MIIMIIPISWSFQRKTNLPILEIKGESTENLSEPIMINMAVEMIESAEKFKGIPLPEETNSFQNSQYALTVSFSLIFPTSKELNSFMESIKKK